MKNHRIILVAVTVTAAAALLCGCGKTQKVTPATPPAAPDQPAPAPAAPAKPLSGVDEWRHEAPPLFFEEITNRVTGLRSIIDSYCMIADPEVTNWSAGATVEYINHFGGVDRTNVQMIFEVKFDDIAKEQYLACHPDYDAEAKKDQEAYQRALENAGKN